MANLPEPVIRWDTLPEPRTVVVTVLATSIQGTTHVAMGSYLGFPAANQLIPPVVPKAIGTPT